MNKEKHWKLIENYADDKAKTEELIIGLGDAKSVPAESYILYHHPDSLLNVAERTQTTNPAIVPENKPVK